MLVLLSFLLFFLARIKVTLLSKLGLILALLGGAYNWAYRLFYGCVPDNVNFGGFIYINYADLSVVCGFSILTFCILLYPRGGGIVD